MPAYHNPWIPPEAIRLLEAERGTILDVGGGASPYCRASHIIDIQPFDGDRLQDNQWGMAMDAAGRSSEDGAHGKRWTVDTYTQLDICRGSKWPFEDGHFDLGLCSHCLEDLRDPLPAARELSRVCKRVLIVTPSRLLEQTMGIDHPRYCGFYHHPWIVFQEKNGTLVFRRKTPIVNLPACHVVCPSGRTLSLEYGAAYFHDEKVEVEERMFWSEREDYEDYRRFIRPYRDRRGIFVRDPRREGWRYHVWRFRQRYLGAI
jgi:SAM-dependent methyltransferase